MSNEDSNIDDIARSAAMAIVRPIGDTEGNSHWSLVLLDNTDQIIHIAPLRAARTEKFYEGVLAEVSPWLHGHRLAYVAGSWKPFLPDDPDAYITRLHQYPQA